MQSEVKPHGCYNTLRAWGYWANCGYLENNGIMQRTYVQDKMTPDCQYRKGVPDDPRCAGCTK